MTKEPRKIGSYSGFYKGNIIRSAYEYIYAIILEKNEISYKKENITYTLKDENNQFYTYTPDFFLYDSNGLLIEIVEIRGHRLNIEERQIDIDRLKELTEIKNNNIRCSLVTEIDIKNMCKKYGLNYNDLKNEWRNSPNTKFNRNDGVFNSRYGVTLTTETKNKISKRRKENIANNPKKYQQYGYDLTKWCKERNYDFLRGERVPRFQIICPTCGKEFNVIQGLKDKTKFCSISCLQQDITNKAQIANKKKGSIKREKRAKAINDWILQQNIEQLESIPYNQIETNLNELINIMKRDYEVMDLRTIMGSVGITSKKKFLDYILKYKIENS